MEEQTIESKSKKISTGVDGLDVLLSGGYPAKRTILVVGGPGSGKTILCAQFLRDGLENKNDRTIYVSLDYTKKAFMQDMLQFGWDFTKLEKNGSFFFLEGSAIRRIPHTKSIEGTLYSPDDLTLEDLMDLLSLHVEKLDAKRVVIDDLTALIFRFPDQRQRRGSVLSLIESLSALNVTALIISEASTYGLSREISPEEYLSDGVIDMFMLKDGTRAIQIPKMRGMPVDNRPHPYSIVDKIGIEVFPNETIFNKS